MCGELLREKSKIASLTKMLCTFDRFKVRLTRDKNVLGSS